MDLREIGWGSVEWIHLTQNREQWQALVNVMMNLQVLVPQLFMAFINLSDPCTSHQ
jgi:hypothetical protein